NYTIHQSLNNDNSISLSVNVTNLGNGNYYITEGWINGLWFGNAGTFHSSGIQDITLHSGNGAPTRTGITNFPITLSSGSNNTKCIIPIYVNDNPNLYDTGRNTWSFRAGDKTYHGFITSIENE